MPLELLLPLPLDGVEGDVELEPLVLLFPEPVAPEDEFVTMMVEEPVPAPVPEGEVLEGLVEELLLPLFTSVLEVVLLLVLLLVSPL